jgi:hypothetical protein
VRALVETFPIISRLKMLRWWGGIVDMTGDRSPIISKTPVDGVFINCGWGTGGFKAIPGSGWAMAELMAKGHSPLAAADRFHGVGRGRISARAGLSPFIDESVTRRGWRIDGSQPSLTERGRVPSGACPFLVRAARLRASHFRGQDPMLTFTCPYCGVPPARRTSRPAARRI